MNETIKTGNFKIETSSLRAYTMLAALALIWLFFQFATGGTFLGTRNLSNLASQTVVTGVLAVGMLMVIVAGQIDLSIGSVLGLAGGIAAILLTNIGLGFVPSILSAIIVGVLVGSIQGSLVAYAKIPAFIVTLGGLLVWRGLIKFISKSETVPINDATFSSIGQQYLAPPIGWVLAGILILAIIVNAFRRARNLNSIENFGDSRNKLIISNVIFIVAILIFVFLMNGYAGIPISVLILFAVASLGFFITNYTTFGRHLYAIGGNADAAKLSGINNKFNILAVYALLGALTGIAALINTSIIGSASPEMGTLKELDAIAACVIGGASLVGGRGTIFGALLGALIMQSLDNGMSLLNVRDFLQDIIKGSILVTAVGLDMIGRK